MHSVNRRRKPAMANAKLTVAPPKVNATAIRTARRSAEQLKLRTKAKQFSLALEPTEGVT
jgi:hypothetical protein